MTHVPNADPHDDPIRRLRIHQSPKRADRLAAMSTVMRGYMPLERDKLLDEEIDELIDGCIAAHDEMERGGTGRLVEGRILVLVGGSGAGKTRALHRAFSKRPEFAGYGDRDEACTLASVVAPSPGVSKQLAKTISTEMGYENLRDAKENIAWELVHRQLPLRGIKFLHIDEVQHLVQNPNPRDVQKVRDTLKGLVQKPRWPVWLILSGLPEVADLIEGDTQLRRRARFLKFEPLSLRKDVQAVGGMILAYCERAKLEPHALIKNGDGTTDEFVARLLHASLAQTGMTIEFIQDAAKAAIHEGSRLLTIKHFETAYHARTGCGRSDNVFAVADWRGIDAKRALYPPVAAPVIETSDRRGPLNKRNS